MKQISTVKDVFEKLGGVAAVAEIVGFSYTRVWNWQDANRERGMAFPAETYVVIQKALAKRGYTAPAHLWGMHEPAGQSS